MDHLYELHSLAGETLALQAVLLGVFGRLAKSDPELKTILAAGLDDAANYVEHVAIRLGTAAPSNHTVKALEIVEGLRRSVIGEPDSPKHVV